METGGSGELRPYVLAVDDNLDTLAILEMILEHQGCEVRTARTGREALAVFDARRPDVVVLDVMMPGMSGLDVCREIKRRSGNVFTPVILLTALTETQNKVEGFAAGADDYVTKPFDPHEVHARVRAMARIKRLQADLTRTQSSLDEASVRLEDWARERIGIDPRMIERPRRCELSILFCDIRDFTRIADQLDPEEVQSLLDEYLEEIGEAATANGGSINKILGDGMMVLFNDPREQSDHRLRALRAAVEMRERARQLDARMHGRLPDRFSVGIGVHTGEATVGRLGRRRTFEYTAVGSAVNLASRLQALAPLNGVIASTATYLDVRDKITVTNERREELKGFAHPVRIAEVVSIRG